MGTATKKTKNITNCWSVAGMGSGWYPNAPAALMIVYMHILSACRGRATLSLNCIWEHKPLE